MQLLTEEQYKKFIELMEQKASLKKLSHGMKLAKSVVLRHRLFYRLHGKNEFHDYAVQGIRKAYTQEELAGIVERLYTDHIAVDRGAILYKATRKVLYRLMKQRKQADSPLMGAAPAPLPAVIGGAAILGQEENGSVLRGDSVLVKSFTPLSPPGVDTHEKKGEEVLCGNARAPVPSGRVKKIMRNKELEASKKEQQALLARASAKCSGEDNAAATVVGNVNLKDSKSLEDEIFGEFPKGIPASQFKHGVKGRQFDIDIHSEGFEKLPMEVRIKAYENYTQKLEIRLAASKKLRALVQESH